MSKKEKFFTEETNDKTNELTGQSPARAETNGPETKYGIICNCSYVGIQEIPLVCTKEIGFLSEGDKVEILGTYDDFYKINIDGTIAYVYGFCIKEE